MTTEGIIGLNKVNSNLYLPTNDTRLPPHYLCILVKSVISWTSAEIHLLLVTPTKQHQWPSVTADLSINCQWWKTDCWFCNWLSAN